MGFGSNGDDKTFGGVGGFGGFGAATGQAPHKSRQQQMKTQRRTQQARNGRIGAQRNVPNYRSGMNTAGHLAKSRCWRL